MTRLFLKIYDLLSRHRTAAGTATVLLLALFAALAARMHYDEDISAFIPLDGQNEKYSEIFNSTGGENRIAVIFKEKENDKARLVALTKDSYDGVWSFDGKTLPEHVCGYDLGIYYEIDSKNCLVYIEYY